MRGMRVRGVRRVLSALLCGLAVFLSFAASAQSPPAAPTNLVAAPLNGEAALSWADPSDNTITGYEVRHATSTVAIASSTWAAISGSASTTVAHVVRSLVNGTRYNFQIRAINTNGTSTPSNIATIQLAADPSAVVTISDANLRAALETETRKSAGDDITQLDMAKLTGTLSLGAMGISDLTGLEHAVNVIRLALFSNSITDVTPLAGLASLTGIQLNANLITDVRPLQSLTSLAILHLQDNLITDVAPLASNTGLGSGDSINLRRNPLSAASVNTHIPVIVGRGAAVMFDALPTNAPSAPRSFTAEAEASGVKLSWTIPRDDSITGYQLRGATSTAALAASAWADVSGSNSRTTEHVAPGTVNLAFELRAVNLIGTSTAASAVVPSLRVDPLALTVPEGGTATYTVRLSTLFSDADVDDVTVTVGGTGSGITAAPIELTFTTSNWNTVQMVTVSAATDHNDVDETATLTHAATGAEYADMPSWVRPGVAVTVDDDDMRGILIDTDPTTTRIDGGTAAVDEGDSAQYTVQLATQPTGSVTVTVTSGDTALAVDDDGSPQTRTLMFSTSTWDTAQTVTLTAAQDGGSAGESVAITHAANGGGYAGVSAPLTVTVNDTVDYDDDDDGLIDIRTLAQLDAVRWDLNGDGFATSTYAATSTYNAAFPTAAAGMGCPDTDDAGTEPGPCIGYELRNDLDFDTNEDGDVDTNDPNSFANWTPIGSSSGGYSAIFDGDNHVIDHLTMDAVGGAALFYQVERTGTVRGVGLRNVDVSATNEASALVHTLHGTVISSWSSGDVRAGTYASGLVLSVNGSSSRVAASFSTVSVTSGGVLGGGLVVFLQDGSIVASYAAGSVNAALHAAGLVGQSVAGTVRASYSIGRVTSSGDGGSVNGFLALIIFGGTYQYNYWDTTSSGASSSRGAAGRTTAQLQTPTSATGTYANWDDLDVAGDGVSDEDPWSFGTNLQYPVLSYDGMDAAAQFAAQPPTFGTSTVARMTFGVDAVASPFQIPAASHPTSPVTYRVVEGLPAGLSFGADDCATARTICGTPTAAGTYTVVIEARNADGIDARLSFTIMVGGIVIDADPSSPETAEPGPLALSEDTDDAAHSDSYTVKLAAAATGLVTVTVTSGDVDAVTAGTGALTFSTSTWNAAQAVTLTAVADDDAGDESVTITHTANGGGYAGISAQLTATVADSDTRDILIDTDLDAEPDGGALALDEEDSARYTVQLATQPTGPVTVTATSPDPALAVDADGSPLERTLTFSMSTWDTAQTVTARALHDDDGVNEMTTIVHAAVGSDYGSVTRSLAAQVSDNDERAVVVAAAVLTLNEGGMASSTVLLATQPTDSVTVAITDDHPDVTVQAPAMLTFSSSTWNTAQTFTISAANDDDGQHETAILTLDPSGADYDVGVASATSTVNLLDKDTRGVTLSGSTLTVPEGSSAEYTVGLETQPFGGDVTVTVGGAADGIAVSPPALTFTGTNWRTAQAVTVSALEDDNHVTESVDLTHAVSGADYGRENVTAGSVRVTTTDNDPPRLRVAPPTLALDEGETDTYTVRLNTLPSDYVTVSVTSGDVGAVMVGTAALTFGTSTWNMAQTVTLMAAQDGDGADESVTITHAASGGGYAGVSAQLTATVDDSAQDYDDNDNGLIDIRTLAQLNAMRWDLDGDGVAVSSASTTYNAAFPTSVAGMGCPDTDDPGSEPGPCIGYELRNDLNFDTDGSGATWTDIGGTATSDANDAYHNGGSGWDPIGTQSAPFNTTFDGGGKIVWNLFIKRSGDYRGLFGATGAASRIIAVGVANARVQDFGTGGALVGLNGGRIAASWSSGFVQGTTAPGGLVGLADRGGQVVASYSTADVVCTGGGGSFAGAGLVGYQGEHGASIVSSYSTGTVTGACPNRYGLVQNAAPATVASSYWDADLSGVDDDGNMASPEGRITAELQTPTAYGTTTPYSAWDDVDVDGDGVAGVALDADDDAWDFGTARQHPVLKFGGFDTAVQFAGQAPSFGTSTLAATLLVGASGATVQVPAASHSSSTLTYTATGLPPGLSFDADGTGACMAVRTICGTPTSGGRYTVVVQAATGAGRSASLSFTVAVGGGGLVIDADPSTPGTVDAGPLALVEDAADGTGYTVKLATAPTGPVTVTVASGDSGAVTVDTDGNAGNGVQSALTFTAQNWSAAQAVTARAVQDLDPYDESVEIAHTASGGGYAGVSAALTATVDDDDTPALLVDADPSTSDAVDAGPLILDEATARSGSYAVRLSFAPSATTTVAVASDNAAVAVDTDAVMPGAQAALTFTPTDWDTWRTVTATTAADADTADEAANVAHVASGADEYAGVSEILRVGVHDADRVGADYDADEDGLIEIASLTQLNAVRWDLDGDGAATGRATTTYAAAFPGAAAGMGCPDGTDSDEAPDACAGYELTRDLDFDTDGSGSTWTDSGGTATSDANDAYHNGGSGWDPIGTNGAPFNTTFDGGGKVVWNLFVKRGGDFRGLFGATGTASRITSVGVANARVQDFTGGGATLAGFNRGRIAASWSSGFVRGTAGVGGLVGQEGSGAQVVASYSTVEVVCTGGGGSFGAGLVGLHNNASIVSSYSTGTVTGNCPNKRGLAYTSVGDATAASSYWDVDLSGIAPDVNALGEGRSTVDLQAPTAYGTTTLYSAWDDVDVDGDGVAGVALDAGDDAWDFGTARQHPVLKFGGFDTAVQFAAQSVAFSTTTVAAATFRTGVPGAFEVPAAMYETIHTTYAATGLPPGLSFGADACGAARAVCGTPTLAGTYTVVVRAANGHGGSASLSFDVTVGGLVIDADPSTPGTVDAGPLALVEDAGDAAHSKSYAVRLAAAPTGMVTVTILSGDVDAVAVDDTDGNAGNGVQSALTFTAQNWSAAQAVTARAVQDLDPFDERVEIAHTASGGGYDGVSAALTTTVADDETPALMLDADALILDEATALSGSYAVRLSLAPSATTTVAVASDNAAVTVDTDSVAPGAQGTLTFTPTDWDTWQTVTATTAADADAVDEVSNVAHAASGTDEYAGVAATLRVGVRDSGRTGTDYDSDEDGLIEIATLAQLNAVRWDLDGDGAAAGGATTTYAAAFPGAAAGMGCPDGSDSDEAPDACAGYELTRDLDFDTDDDGSTWADMGGTPTSDADDAYHNGGSGWLPIGTESARFNTTFDGGGKVIWNLFVSRNANYIGLFGSTGASSVITSVGLANARVQGSPQGPGTLVGFNRGRIAASWSSGSVQGVNAPGGLAGLNYTATGAVVASYSTAAVECTGSNVGAGLVGHHQDTASRIVSSYATGAVTGSCGRRNGIVGRETAISVTSTYWDVDLSGINDDNDMDPPEGRSTAQLQAPTAYGTTTPYSAWDDVDVDGDGLAGVALDADDDAWDFGTERQHPVLKFGGFDTAVQFAAQSVAFSTTTVAAATFRTGVPGAFEVPAAVRETSRTTYTATGLPPGLSFGADACGAARAVCGTPTLAGTYTVVVRAANGHGGSASLSFDVTVGGLVIDADPSTPLAVDAGPLALVEDAGDAARSKSYAVRLAAAPTGMVTVTILSGDADAVAVDDTDGNAGNGVQSALTFTAQNWSAAQAVTARAVQDLDPYDESVEIAHTASGGGYAGVSAALTATVDDDDTPALLVDADPSTSDTVDAGPLILDEATARSGSYAVRLSFAPSATTTVAVVSDNAAVAVDTDAGMPGAQAALTFTPTDWDTWRTVTATTTADADTADEAANVAHAASGADEYAGVSETLRVGVHDADRVGADYDADEDGLIEIASLAQLNAVRWDLDGDGAAAGGATTAYAAAFPGAAAGMGCPDGSDSDEDPDACAGYELTRDLDFDTDGSGSTWTDSGGTATSDANDAYHNGGSGWNPIGGTGGARFNTTFDGNGKVIWNLFIKDRRDFQGLFGYTEAASRITSVGVANARVQDFGASGGALVGFNRGRIAASWSSGFVRGDAGAGGLVGRQEGSSAQVVASYSTVEVVCVGGRGSFGAGLVGYHGNASIVSSYSTGTVTGSCPNKRGLAYSVGAATVASSYWDTNLSNIADDGDMASPEGRSSVQLRTPTAYGTTTLYSAWDDVDVDGDGVAGVALDADDDAWDFGTDQQHPVLKFGGFDTAVQFAAQPVSFGTITVAAATFRTGVPGAFEVPAAVRETIHTTYTATGLPPGLSFGADACGAARTVCGTPTLAGTYTVVVWAANGHGGRASLSFDIAIAVRGLVIDAAVTLNEGGTASSPVRLATRPTGTVTVAITGDHDDVTAAPAMLTFLTSTWNAAQTFTIRAGEDDDGQDETATLTLDPSGADYDEVPSATPTVYVTDDDPRGVTLSVSALSVPEGGSAEYTVRLATQPVGDVTVTVGGAGSGISANPAALMFHGTNWRMWQTVTVSAAGDSNPANESVDLTHAVAGADYGRESVTAGNVRVTVTDNDAPSLRVAPTALVLTEEGASGAYAVRLNTLPSGAVTVTVGGVGDGLSVVPTALTFTTSTWSVAQPVTVRALADDDATSATTTLTHAVGGLGDYASLNAEARPGVHVTVEDDDTREILLDADPGTPGDAAGPLALHERPEHAANTKLYTVRLATQPTDAVQVSIGSGDRAVSVDGDSTPRTRTLTFSMSTWSTAQTVTATAAQDDDASDEEVAIAHEASGGDYGDVSATLTATTADDDAPGLVLATSTLSAGVAEGSTATYTVRLATQPTGPVTVAATVTTTATGAVELDVDGGQAGVQSSLRFDAANWDVTRTVTLRGLEDDDGADGAATLRHAASGADYRDVAAPDEPFDVRDDDVRAVLVGASTVAVNEASTATYTVRLGTRPVGGPVAVSLSSSDAAAATASPTAMTFTGSNWSSPQRATVRGVADADTSNATATIAHAASGADYGGLSPASVSIQVRDAQAAAVRVEPPALSVREGGSGEYRMRLNTQPAAAVTVTASTAAAVLGVDADATPQTRTLTFTMQDWAVEQEVTVTVGVDANANDEMLTVTHSVSGYAGVAPSLAVHVADADAPGMVFDPVGGVSVSEAGLTAATYTVALSAQPTGPVTVSVSSDDAGVAVDTDVAAGDQDALTFNAASWSTVRTVTVRAAPDVDAASETVALLHAASGGGYDGVSATYAVQALDVDAVSVPMDVAAAPAGPTSLAVSWTPSLGADAHLLQWRPVGGEWSASRQRWLAGGAGSARIDGLSAGTTYEVRVLSVNRGGPGEPSSVARATTQASGGGGGGGGSGGGGGGSGGGGGGGLPEPESVTLTAPAEAAAPEGGTARLTARLSAARDVPTRIVWSVAADADAATADADAADLATASGAATIAAGETQTAIAIAIADDEEIEPAREWFEVSLSAPDGCCGAAVRARVAVLEGVCDRTPAVRDALRGSAACTASTPATLAALARLEVSGAGSLRVGDFAGLSGLGTLDLSGNGLGTLPADLFAGLGALRTLDLSANALMLPARPFAALGGLRALLLEDNGFEALPAGLFAGLGGLREVSLEDNPGAPFALAVELVRTDADPSAPGPARVRARFAPGAPFALLSELSAAPAATGLPAAVAIGAGAASGAPFAVAASASALRLAAGPAALPTTRCGAAPCFRGFEAVPGAALVLYRRSPQARPAPALEALEGGDDLRLALGSLIDLGAGDPAALRWRASSSDESVATARVLGGDLVVTPAPGGEGAVEIVLEVVDEAGLSATLRFEVRVEFYWPASLVGGWRGGALIEAAGAAAKSAQQ